MQNSGDPKKLRELQDSSEEAFEDLQKYLNTGCMTPGSKIDNYLDHEEDEEAEY